MNTPYRELAAAIDAMILSASGWRTVFAVSGDENDAAPQLADTGRDIAFFAAQSFAAFLRTTFPAIHTVIVARDSRPTGAALAEEAITGFLTASDCSALTVQSIGIASAPEIMAYSRTIGAAFMYISASHNPIGHNGIKFGLDSGGVLDGEQSAQLIALFKHTCAAAQQDTAKNLRAAVDSAKLKAVFDAVSVHKHNALTAYRSFLREVIADSKDDAQQNQFFNRIKAQCAALSEAGKPFTLVADFNGSARAASVDRQFFEEQGMRLVGIAEQAGDIVHGIIPEGDNLKTCAEAIERLRQKIRSLDTCLTAMATGEISSIGIKCSRKH